MEERFLLRFWVEGEFQGVSYIGQIAIEFPHK